jgi:type IV secretion system protein VirB10
MGEGKGLALAPPPNSPAVMLPDQKPSAPAKTEPLLVVRDKREEPDQYQRELENLRRMKAQTQLTALSAPLGVRKASVTPRPAPAEQSKERDPGNPLKDFDPYSLRESSYDPAADRDKEAFFDRAASAIGRQDGGQPRSASAAGTTFPANESESRTGRAGERAMDSAAWPDGGAAS